MFFTVIAGSGFVCANAIFTTNNKSIKRANCFIIMVSDMQIYRQYTLAYRLRKFRLLKLLKN